MNKCTPAPWSFEEDDDGFYEVFQVDEENVCVAPVGSICEEADARLIAAAPDLLTALQALLNAVDGVPCGPEDQCRAAIAKATTSTEQGKAP